MEKDKVKNSAKGFLAEFKKFIARGNVIDLAVGVVIGGAFGNIVSSLVNDIIMPVIGVILGGINFRSLTINVKNATICYGSFIQNVLDFLIMAFCIMRLRSFDYCRKVPLRITSIGRMVLKMSVMAILKLRRCLVFWTQRWQINGNYMDSMHTRVTSNYSGEKE